MKSFKKKFQQISNIFLLSVVLFISVNFLLGWVWEIRTFVKFKNFEPYDEIVRKSLGLNKKDAVTLFIETHVTGGKYEYAPYLGHVENQGYDNKFVNVSAELGRKTISPSVCKKNIFLYGGSTTFGAGVTDNQTIASYLGQILIDNKKNICVKNYGRRSYYSFQESILFQKHILKGKMKSNDIIIFLDGINEYGYRDPKNTNLLTQLFSISNQKYWNMQNIGFLIFLDSLTINQFVKVSLKKIYKKNSNKPEINYTDDYFENIKTTFKNNIIFRDSICKNYDLTCFNLLQPFATIHGMYFKKQIGGVNKSFVNDEDSIKFLKKRWDALKEVKGTINISDALKNSKKLGYVDRVHYSPYANKRIAKKIFSTILKDIN
jgi:hypothetical protein